MSWFCLLLSLTIFAADPIKSQEDISFVSVDKMKVSAAGKISEFKGVIERTYFGIKDLKVVDLYQFNTDKIKVNEALCAEYIEKIFGLKDSKLFEIKSLKLAESNKGKICEIYVTDKKKQKNKSEEFHRLASIGFVNAKLNVLVYHLSDFNDAKIQEARKFWNSLR